MPRGGNFADAYSSSNLSTAMNASVGICTVPKLRIFFLPAPRKPCLSRGPPLHFTCSGGVNPPCAKVFACGENACTAQRRRRPEGRSFRVVNIQIDLALHKKPWNFNGSRVFLFALNCKILVHCRPGGVLNLIFCISANHIFDAIACQKFILDVCHLCNKEPGISKRGDVILHSPFIMWKKFITIF